ncbi:hypothetical protein [Altererythrobacter sp. Root672]|uniref:hypothetical protein n=1 Tax=Altererythrobacter sp. Root672 TaxID=1736584 RepID=UPI0006F491B7|nr:hypothetical protein [Altererythrobacter sp. Root672]KRA82896.1 hypothetical protein ASD76_02055 [Altererythrobacter sp. Root672]
MKSMLSWFAAAALLTPLTAQARDETNVFRPSGNWTADYGNDYCRLIRTFTDGQREFTLALERLQPEAQVRLIMVGEALRPFQGADQIGYQFQPGGASGKARFARSETADGSLYVSFDPITLAPPPTFTHAALGAASSPPPMYNRADEQATARAITGFMLTEGLVSPVRVETGSLGAPIEALQACADDLLTVWGLDAEKHKTMSAMPILIPNRKGVLPHDAVPFNEFYRLRSGGLQTRLPLDSGANQVRLLIGTDGNVTECAIISPSLAESLNHRICNLAKERASFQPARDVAGQPMASVWIGSPVVLGPQPRAMLVRQGWYMPEPRQVPVPDVPQVVIIVPPGAFGSTPPGS